MKHVEDLEYSPLLRVFQKRVWPQNSSEVGTAQPHSLYKYRGHAHA